MHDLNFIEKIQNELYLHRGFSFNTKHGFHPPKEGFVVGGIDEDLIFDSIESLSKGKEEIMAYLHQYGAKGEDFFLGGWIDEQDKKVHIEPSELFLSRYYAMKTGIERNQKMVYELRTGQDILIEKEL